MLCALGSATFSTAAVLRWSVPVGVVSFLVASTWLTPDPAWTGATAALVSALLLVRPQSSLPAAAIAGCLAGLWMTLLEAQGVPMVGALGLAAAVPAASGWMARTRDEFAPSALREDALLAIGGLGLVVAMGPDILAGWQSAGSMNLDPGGGRQAAIEVWLIVAIGTAALGGGVHALWSRR